MLNDIAQWVAIYTKARAEKQVAMRLEQSGYESYLPINRERHKWKDRYKMVEVPLFRSYVFVKIRAKDVVPVRSTDGVSHIVSFGNEIEPIPDSQIDTIRAFLEAEQTLYVENSNALKRGARVRVKEGGLAGSEGELIKDYKNGNFGVRVKVLNMIVMTTIDRELLEVVKG